MSEADEQTGATPDSSKPGQKQPSLKLGKMSWTELLSQAGIPDAPGYQECLEICRKKPKKPERRKKGKRK